MRRPLLSLFLAVLAAPCWAQSLRTIPVQGVLTGSNGAIRPDGTYTLTFRVYDAPDATAVRYSETDTVSVRRGIFTASLGAPGGLPDALTFDRPYTLGVQVQGEAQEMAPRLPLQAVPYALALPNVTTTSGGFVGVGTTAPRATLEVTPGAVGDGVRVSSSATALRDVAFELYDGGSERMALALAGQTGHWSWNALPGDIVLRTNGGKLLIQNGQEASAIAVSGNRVGIGTASPVTSLDVSGVIRSSAGGFRFPDGTTQTTAATGGPNGWSLSGNAGTSPGLNFLGTVDNQAIEVKVNGQRALRLEPNPTSPNLLGGLSINNVTPAAFGATISGGGSPDIGAGVWPNRVTDNYGTIGGGANNQAGDGAGTTDDARYATVSGGHGNTAGGPFDVIAGGFANSTSGIDSTVSGGSTNAAISDYAMVSGGYGNQAKGPYAAIPGGSGNTVQGSYGLAAGRRAKANDAGSFVWGDSTDADVTSQGANSFTVRATGGVFISTGASNAAYAWLPAGNPSWTVGSDRAIKENFSPVDSKDILDRLAALPVSTWSYKAQNPSIRHMGPMAQDFSAAFGLGEDDKHIGTVDAQGVAMAAIQGLYQVVKEKDAAIDAQQRQITDLQAQVSALQQQNARMEDRFNRLEEKILARK